MSLWNNWYNTINTPFAYNIPLSTLDPRWLNTSLFGVEDAFFGCVDPRFGVRGNSFGVPISAFGVNPIFGFLNQVNPFLNTLHNFGVHPFATNWNDVVRFGLVNGVGLNGLVNPGINLFGGVNPIFTAPFGAWNVNPIFGMGTVPGFGFPVTTGFASVNPYIPTFGGVGYGYTQGITPGFGYGFGYPTTNTWTTGYGSGYFTGSGIGSGSVATYPQNGTLVGSIDNRR